jgi:hypothetical protein
VGAASDFNGHRGSCEAASIQAMRIALGNALQLLQKERQASSKLRDQLESEKRKDAQPGGNIDDTSRVRELLEAERKISEELRAQIIMEQTEIAQLSAQSEAYQREMANARERLEEEEEASLILRNKASRLARENSDLFSQLHKSKLSVEHLLDKLDHAVVYNLDPTYSYNSKNVTELAGLILKNLDECPEGVDPNRIFNCINRVYQAGRRDHPEYPWDAPMLVSVSQASNWFTGRQYEDFRVMMTDLATRW